MTSLTSTITHITRLAKSIRPGLRLHSSLRSAKLAAACGAFALAGCSLGVQDAPKAQGPLKLSVGDQKCLEDAIPVVQSYFQGQASAEEVSAGWDCASKAIDMFVTYTRGTQGTTYTPEELRSFVETYFLDTTKISDRLLLELMKIKQTVVGGEINSITPADLAVLHDVIAQLKTHSIKLLPYIRVLSLDMDVTAAQKNPALVEAAIAQATESLNDFGQYLGRSKANYELDDVVALVKEMRVLAPSWTWTDTVLNHLDTITVGKAFFIKAPGNILAPDEWKPLAAIGARLFTLYLRTYYLLANRDLLSGPGLDQLTEALVELFNLFDVSLKSKPDGVIHYGDLDALVEQLVKVKIITWSTVRMSTLHDLTHNIVERIFNAPNALGVRNAVDGIDQPILTRMRTGFMGWIDMQRVWRDLVAKAVSEDPALAGKPIPIATVRRLWKTMSSPYDRPYKDFTAVFNRKQPLSFTNEGYVIFEKAKDVAYDQEAFDSLNWKMHFARVIAMGFAKNPDGDPYSGVTRAEFKEFFDQARDLAIDLRFVKPDDDTLWSSVFMESNMFLLSSDANNQLSFEEGIDFISYAMSGVQMVNPLYTDVKANCPNMTPDVFGRPTIEIQCYRERFRLNFAQNTKALPNWVKMAAGLDRAAFNQMELEIEKIARKPIGPERIESSEIHKMMMLMQYLETLYTRFDKDKSQTLSFAEAKGVYPMFHDILAKASGLTKENEILGLYAYILNYKHPPETLADKIYFKLIWLDSQSKWAKIEVDRLDLLNIVSQLASSI